MFEAVDRIEELLDYGGLKKDILFLTASIITLILSLALPSGTFPFDPAWIAVVLCGTPILIGAIIGLFFRFDIKADVLVAIALVASLYIGEIFAAGVVAAIMIIGELLEDYTSEKAEKSLRKLMDMKPKTARIIRDGEEDIISASLVKIGDIVRVVAGESIPVDGVIVSGNTSIDQSMMTGESVPVDKTVGDEVMSGTINQFGSFDMTATKVGEDSSIEKMIRLIDEADANKAPIVHAADRWATWFVLIALTTGIIVYLITKDIVRAVTVLVIFCPCAFILATPTAVIAAISNATKHGFIVKSGAAMESLSRIDTITFDKTGTITYGVPTVTDVVSTSDMGKDELFRLCAIAEKRSEHPLGRAIVRSYGAVTGEPADFMSIPGKGIRCRVEGHDVLAGNRLLMEENGIGTCDQGNMTIFVAIDGSLCGYVTMEDVIRDDSKVAIERIRSLDIEPILMTGDNDSVAEKMARTAGIDDYISECLPKDKMDRIDGLQKEGRKVCMIGDGINDAPALKRADVGIAMGGIGSDIAIDASDITLVSDDIRQLPHMFALSRKMMRKITFNIILSMTLNIAAVTLAALGLLGPVAGALVHNVGSVTVVVNSILLLRWRSDFERTESPSAVLNTESAMVAP